MREFSVGKVKVRIFIQFEKPWIDCKVVCIVVRLAATQHFNMQYSIDKVADSTCVALNVPFPKLILNGVINESIDFWFYHLGHLVFGATWTAPWLHTIVLRKIG